MNLQLRLVVITAFLILTVTACSMFNPFVGKWQSGLLEFDFKSDKTFKLVIGSTISINLEGSYSYDNETITLDIEGDTSAAFSYTFKDGKNKLVLVPKGDFEYIKTKIELEKK